VSVQSQDSSRTIRRLILYTLLVNVIAWAGPSLGGDPTSPGPGFLLWATAPMVVSLLMRAVTGDWEDLGAKARARENLRWYLFSFLAYPVAISLTLGLGVLLGTTSIDGFSASAFSQAALPALVVYLFFALFEEIGWRGYLASKMISLRMNAFATNALVGIIWASWHLPYIAELSAYTTESMVTYLPRFALGTFAFAMVYGEIRICTVSFWPAVLMHWIGNAIANPLIMGFVTFTPGLEFLGSFGVDGMLMVLLFGLLGVTLHLRGSGRRGGV
jgi:membrane protease YdiL (CAAX protease family)